MIEIGLKKSEVPGGPLTYVAAESGQTLGECVFTSGTRKGEILKIEMTADGLSGVADGLLRSALSYMSVHGISRAECRSGVDEKLLVGVGFKKDGGVWSVEPDAVFGGCGTKS
jgi:hypothetical protein